jgi:hypothetical protein
MPGNRYDFCIREALSQRFNGLQLFPIGHEDIGAVKKRRIHDVCEHFEPIRNTDMDP